MRSRRTIAYAVTAALVVALALVVGWFTTPRTAGLEGQWEASAVRGEVLGGRALVSADSNVAIDLVSGTRITLGSVTGGSRAIGAGRLLVLRDTAPRRRRVSTAGRGGPGRDLPPTRSPSSQRVRRSTVVQACGGTPGACRLIGVDNNGRQSWQTPQPTATGTSTPVVGTDGNLPTVGRPHRRRRHPAPHRPRVEPGRAASCSQRLRRPRRSAHPECRLGGPVRAHDLRDARPGDGGHDSWDLRSADPADPTTGHPDHRDASGVWWWPFGDGRPTLEVGGRHTGQVVSREPLRSLRVDDAGLTVLDGEVVRRYAWVSGG